MQNDYVIALRESLEKKLKVVEEIRRISELQNELVSETGFDFQKLDTYVDDKAVCIEKLEKLDEGFEILYERVREELQGNKDKYADEIAKMQDLISRITEENVSIQAIEMRNKVTIEQAFRDEHKNLGENRRSLSAAKNYYQQMSASGILTSNYLDKKK